MADGGRCQTVPNDFTRNLPKRSRRSCGHRAGLALGVTPDPVVDGVPGCHHHQENTHVRPSTPPRPHAKLEDLLGLDPDAGTTRRRLGGVSMGTRYFVVSWTDPHPRDRSARRTTCEYGEPSTKQAAIRLAERVLPPDTDYVITTCTPLCTTAAPAPPPAPEDDADGGPHSHAVRVALPVVHRVGGFRLRAGQLNFELHIGRFARRAYRRALSGLHPHGRANSARHKEPASACSAKDELRPARRRDQWILADQFVCCLGLEWYVADPCRRPGFRLRLVARSPPPRGLDTRYPRPGGLAGAAHRWGSADTSSPTTLA